MRTLAEKEKEKSRLGPPRSQLFDGSMLDLIGLEVKGNGSSNAMEPLGLQGGHVIKGGLGGQRGQVNPPTKPSHPAHPRTIGSHAHDPHPHPMTPPRVSGVSLAPKAFEAEPILQPNPASTSLHPQGVMHLPSLALPTHGSNVNDRDAQQAAASGGITQRGGRISNTGGGDGGGGPLQLMAEGKAMGGGRGAAAAAVAAVAAPLTKNPGPVPSSLSLNTLNFPQRHPPPLSPHIDPNLTHYREINGDDSSSMCGTPPAINLAVLEREFDRDHPLGPLSPNPLSPSILTICRGMTLGETRPPKGQKGIYDSIDADEDEEGGFIARGEGEMASKPTSRGGIAPEAEDSTVDVDGDGGLSAWAKQYQEIQKLPDMRLNLISPELGDLEKCESPANLPR